MDAGPLILALSFLAVGSILAGVAGQKVDAPILLVFLVAGMLAGREGPGGIIFDDTNAAVVWGSAALAAILFDGGLRARASLIADGLKPGLSLAVIGTALTALLLVPAAMGAFNLDFPRAFLLAAVVCSTDAAAVFALIASGARLKERVAATLEAESGLNDPVAVLLVVLLAEAVATGTTGWADWLIAPAVKLIGGGFLGIGVGAISAMVVQRIALPVGLLAILATGFGFLAFGIAETVGASGFMAIYVAGVVLARRAPAVAASAAPGVDGIAWLAQTGLFLMLGLLITPSHLAVVAGPAFLVALALIFIARPLAVTLALLPFRFPAREVAFIAWTGLRGATPVFLGLLPAFAGVANANLYLSAAAVVVLLSLVIQGWTAPIVARFLGMGDGGGPSRGEGWARGGAVAATIFTGGWFAYALTPSMPPVAQVPENTQALTTLLGSIDVTKAMPLIASFPEDFSARPVEERKPIFAFVMRRVLDSVNEGVEADRAVAQTLAKKLASGQRLTLSEDATLNSIATRYGVKFERTGELLRRLDTVPTDLGVAQAVLATAWGGEANLMQRNKPFGRGGTEGFADLSSAAEDYLFLINTHPDFKALRAARAEARERGEPVTAAMLAPFVAPYAASGKAYAAAVADVLAAPELTEP